LHISPRVERRGDAASQAPTSRRPALPDLRFEYSYLKSISSVYRQSSMVSPHRKDGSPRGKPFLSSETAPVDSTDAQPRAEVPITQSLCRVPISIEWEQLLWITTRDQVLSPFLQGALWYVSSLITQDLLPYTEPNKFTHDARLWLVGEL